MVYFVSKLQFKKKFYLFLLRFDNQIDDLVSFVKRIETSLYELFANLDVERLVYVYLKKYKYGLLKTFKLKY